jgi:hypothetical protein
MPHLGATTAVFMDPRRLDAILGYATGQAVGERAHFNAPVPDFDGGSALLVASLRPHHCQTMLGLLFPSLEAVQTKQDSGLAKLLPFLCRHFRAEN